MRTRLYLRLASLAAALLVTGVAAQTPPALHTIDGNSIGDWLGYSTKSAGDVDGDGYDDLLLGAPFDDEGIAKVVSGLTGALLHELRGQSFGDGFGAAVACAGDVDGDGRPDLVVGAYLDDDYGVEAGSAWIYSGADFSLLRTLSNGVPGSQFGWAVAGAGDVDQDGFDDVVVGAPFDTVFVPGVGVTAPGSATVYSGATGAVLRQWFGDGADDHFGWSVDLAGDVDLDGWVDLIVGAPWDDNSFPKSGMARVLSTNPALAGAPTLYTFDGDGLGYEFGTSVCGAGDVDGDGHPDLFVGQPEDKVFGDDAGSAALFSGATGARLATFYGTSAYSYYGASVDAGDVDADGVPDLIVGEPRHDVAPFDDRGAVYVYSGALHASPQSQSLLLRCEGSVTGGWLGHSVGYVGNANGDVFGDFVGGAPFAATTGSGAGRAESWGGTTFQGSAVTYGAGCPAATPLTLAYGGQPRVGQPFDVLVSGGPSTSTLAWVLFGFDAGPPFPIGLDFLGFVGCTMYQHGELLAPVTMVGGAASFTLTVSPLIAPTGLRFYNQALALDAGSPFGVRISDAGVVVMGL